MGTIGKFPAEYMGALVQGQALGGIIAVGVNILMLAFGMDDVRYVISSSAHINVPYEFHLFLALHSMTSWWQLLIFSQLLLRIFSFQKPNFFG